MVVIVHHMAGLLNISNKLVCDFPFHGRTGSFFLAVRTSLLYTAGNLRSCNATTSYWRKPRPAVCGTRMGALDNRRRREKSWVGVIQPSGQQMVPSSFICIILYSARSNKAIALKKNPPFLLKMAAPKVQRNFCVVVVFFCGGARIIGQSVRESPRGFTLTFVSSEFVAVFAQTVLLLPEERNCKGQWRRQRESFGSSSSHFQGRPSSTWQPPSLY